MATSAFGATTASSRAVGIGTAAARGGVAGAVAALAMAAYAMIAALTYQGTGFFTPLYHIAATLISGDAMMQSMEAAMTGDRFTFLLGPAALGALVHMMVGAGYGAAFAVLGTLLRLRGAALAAAGLLWGLVVFAVSAWIGLPVAAALFGGGEPIADMASMVGYPTFLVEHLLYGTVLGLVLVGARANRR